MGSKTNTTWTCDKCSAQTVENGKLEPAGWKHYWLVDENLDLNQGIDFVLCHACCSTMFRLDQRRSLFSWFISKLNK